MSRSVTGISTRSTTSHPTESHAPISIRWGAVGLYVFLFLLIQLGRFHIGLAFDYLMFVMLFLPIASVIHLFISIGSVKYHQEFDTDHPIKGQELTYTLLLANESYLASAPISISFRTVQPGSPLHIEDLRLSMKRGERSEHAYTISCPYRGIYTVGLERMEMTDLLGWITIARPVWHRTFYVYPRVLDAEYPFDIGDVSDLSTGPNPGASQDYSLFESLVPYRHGESVRHMAWKKFFALGEPFLKSYARTSQPGISIYLDLRRREEPVPAVLEREDCSIEILVSLAKYFFDRSVPVSIHAMGQTRYGFSGEGPAAFERFHKDTVNILFTHTVSPAALYRGDAHEVAQRTSVLFITHLLDPEIIEVIEDTLESSATEASEVACILNQSGMDETELEASRNLFDALHERGGNVLLVRSSESISGDMRRSS